MNRVQLKMLFSIIPNILSMILFGLAIENKTHNNLFFPPNFLLVSKKVGFSNISEEDMPILRRQYVSYYAVVNVETQLRLFIRRLREFLLQGSFDFALIEAYAAELGQEFEVLETQTENLSVFRNIKKQREVVKNMLEAMHGSIKDLQYCESAKAGSSYICKVIELHLKLVALFDSVEPGDPRYKDYETEFLRLCSALSSLEDSFKALAGVDSEETEVFQNYFTPAKKILHEMGMLIPGYSK